jgi:hypothetical protein
MRAPRRMRRKFRIRRAIESRFLLWRKLFLPNASGSGFSRVMAEIDLLWRYYLGIKKLMAQIHFLMAKTIRPVGDLAVEIIPSHLS